MKIFFTIFTIFTTFTFSTVFIVSAIANDSNRNSNSNKKIIFTSPTLNVEIYKSKLVSNEDINTIKNLLSKIANMLTDIVDGTEKKQIPTVKFNMMVINCGNNAYYQDDNNFVVIPTHYSKKQNINTDLLTKSGVDKFLIDQNKIEKKSSVANSCLQPIELTMPLAHEIGHAIFSRLAQNYPHLKNFNLYAELEKRIDIFETISNARQRGGNMDFSFQRQNKTFDDIYKETEKLSDEEFRNQYKNLFQRLNVPNNEFPLSIDAYKLVIAASEFFSDIIAIIISQKTCNNVCIGENDKNNQFRNFSGPIDEILEVSKNLKATDAHYYFGIARRFLGANSKFQNMIRNSNSNICYTPEQLQKIALTLKEIISAFDKELFRLSNCDDNANNSSPINCVNINLSLIERLKKIL
ncbi:MAG: hypothetical protein HQK49_00755 [Oligoflexia bacterium]|nr:hypothetical protein [Oligoflexia bacterium]